MAGEKKRFPWWLVVGALLAVLLAVALAFIETVGRQGSLTERNKRIDDVFFKRPLTEKDFVAVLGAPTQILKRHETGQIYEWQDGPVQIQACFSGRAGTEWHAIWTSQKEDSEYRPSISWRIRRWARQAYTAIHGPLR